MWRCSRGINSRISDSWGQKEKEEKGACTAGWREHQGKDRVTERGRCTRSSPEGPLLLDLIFCALKTSLQVCEHPGSLEVCFSETGLKFKLSGLSSL